MKIEAVTFENQELADAAIAQRLFQASHDSPMMPYVFSQTGMTAEHMDMLENVTRNCFSHGICEHGRAHNTHVAKNALLIGDMTREEARLGNVRLRVDDSWDDTITDASLLFVTMRSDLPYANEANVAGLFVPDHAKQSAIELELLKQAVDEGQRLPSDELQQNFDLYKTALGLTIADALLYVQNLGQQQQPLTSGQLFCVIPKIADSLDLYRASRVSTVEPEANKDNHYFQLAHAVAGYEVANTPTSLTYRVQLQPDHYFYTPDGLKLCDFDSWYAESCRPVGDHAPYAQAWNLVESFAALFGKEFKIEAVEADLPAKSQVRGQSLYSVSHR